jgi:5-formyltetrahydrofolate cyclo-ligase
MTALTVRGYYDSLLRTLPASTRTVAVGFAEQLVDRIPVHDGDTCVQELRLF